MLLSTPPWKLSSDLPWHHFTSPADKWATQPTFLIGEWMFIALAALCLWHAWRQPSDPADNQRRRHLLAWGAALLAGTANDLIFMTLPLVDNFWQAQATVMLTPRLPLYIPTVYICFMYIPTVSVWRLGLPRWGAAALSGLLGSLFYAPYDIVGAKYLWWTWHDTDKPIGARLLGAPVGSTMWVITFVAAFAWYLSRSTERDKGISGATAAKALAWVAGLSTITMMLQMTPLQQLDGGAPGPISLGVVIALYLGVIARGWKGRTSPVRFTNDRALLGAVAAYFIVLTALIATFDPTTHTSASLHQTYGPCHVEAKDIAGNTRFEYVCAEDYDEDYALPSVPAPMAEWYTVKGKPFESYGRWVGGVAGLGALGIALYAWLLRRRTA